MLRKDVERFMDGAHSSLEEEKHHHGDSLDEYSNEIQENHKIYVANFKKLKAYKEAEEEGMENCNEEDEERKDEETPREVVHKNYDHQSQYSVSSSKCDRCAICFDSIRTKDLVKVLPCWHYYHCGCID